MMINLKRNSMFIVVVLAIVLVFSVSLIRNFDNSQIAESQLSNHLDSDTLNSEDLSNDQLQQEQLVVDVKGAVVSPGVYLMDKGDRMFQVIEKANGFQQDANVNVINLALILEDEMIIYVPFFGEETPVAISATAKETGKISINRATSEELQKIPGIGPSKAASIISYREEFGPFKTVEELTKVSGIGQKSVEKMLDYIDVR